MTVSTTYAGAASSGLQTSHSVDAASYTAPHAPDKPSQSSTSTASVHGLEHRRTPDNSRTRDHVSRPTDDNCDRRRPEEEPSRLSHKSTALIGKSITPFLRQHIPGVYAPLGKAGSTATMSKDKDPNSKFCYRHNPTSKCRRAADAHKMEKIQCELDKLPPDDQQAITHVWSLFSAAPAKHRELMLQGIITQCCFPQLSTVSREVQDQLKIDFLSALPNEICYQILCYLDTVSLCKAAQVSHRWHSLADDDLVWHRMCEQHIDRKCAKCGWGLPLLERHRLKQPANGSPAPAVQAPLSPPDSQRTTGKRNASVDAESSTSKRKCISRVSGEIITHETRVQLEAERLHHPWKSVYRTRFMVGFNWRRGRCSIDVFKGHTNGVTCLQLDDGMLASGSYDGTIKLWDLETRREMLTLAGHTSGIRALQFDKKILVSASLDNTIKIWKRQTGELLSTLQGHNSGVLSVHFAGDYLASGSMDHAVKIFNFKTRETFCLRGHTDFVNQVFCDVKSMTVLSASDDLTVKLWDLRTKKCIMTYEGHVGQVQQVLPMPEDFEPELGILKGGEDTASVASGCSAQDKLDRAHDRALYGPGFEDTDRPLPPTYFITGALDGTLRLFHGPTKKCLKTFFGHVEGIWGVAGNTLRLATGSNDATVKVWDARTGKCELTFTGHTGPVMCVGMSDSKLASGSDDGTIRLYNFDGMGMEEAETPC